MVDVAFGRQLIENSRVALARLQVLAQGNEVSWREMALGDEKHACDNVFLPVSVSRRQPGQIVG